MATRYYYGKTDDHGKTITSSSYWDADGSTHFHRTLTKTLPSTSSNPEIGAHEETSTQNPYRVMLHQHIYRIGAKSFTTSQQVWGAFNCYESSGNMNAYAAWSIRIWREGYGIVGTLFEGTSSSAEIDTSGPCHSIGPTLTLLQNNVTALNGDYLVVEIGYAATNTKATAYTGYLPSPAYYTTTECDYADNTTTGGSAWIEFNTDVPDYSDVAAPSVTEKNTLSFTATALLGTLLASGVAQNTTLKETVNVEIEARPPVSVGVTEKITLKEEISKLLGEVRCAIVEKGTLKETITRTVGGLSLSSTTKPTLQEILSEKLGSISITNTEKAVLRETVSKNIGDIGLQTVNRVTLKETIAGSEGAATVSVTDKITLAESTNVTKPAINLVAHNATAQSDDSVPCNLGSSVTAGNLIVIYAQGNGAEPAAASVSPTGFTQSNSTSSGSGTNRHAVIFYKIAAGTEGSTFTVTWTGVSSLQVHVSEWSTETGWATTPLDGIANTDDTGVAVETRSSGTTSAIAQSVELAVAGFGFGADDVTGRSFTNSFSELDYDGTLTYSVTAFKYTSIAEAIETTASWTSTTRCGGIIATFKPLIATRSISVTEKATLKETVSLTLGEPRASVVEKATLKETVSGKSGDLSRAITEKATLKDIISGKPGALAVSTTTRATLKDVLSLGVGSPLVSTTTRATLKETVTANYPVPVSVTEKVTLKETPSGKVGDITALSVTEKATLKETPSWYVEAVGEIQAQSLDKVAIVESVDTEVGAACPSVTEKIAIVETISGKESDIARAIQERVAIVESISRQLGTALRSLTEKITLSESVSRNGGALLASITEKVVAQETLSRSLGDISASITESVTLKETIGAAKEATPSVTENIAISEEVSAKVGDVSLSTTTKAVIREIVSWYVFSWGQAVCIEDVWIQETVSVRPEIHPSVTDKITLAESISTPMTYDGVPVVFNTFPRQRIFSRIYPKPLVTLYVEVSENVAAGEEVP